MKGENHAFTCSGKKHFENKKSIPESRTFQCSKNPDFPLNIFLTNIMRCTEDFHGWKLAQTLIVYALKADLINLKKLVKNYCFLKKKNTFATRFWEKVYKNNRKYTVCQRFSS